MSRIKTVQRVQYGRFNWLYPIPEDLYNEYITKTGTKLIISIDPGLDFGVAIWLANGVPPGVGDRMPMPIKVGLYTGLASAPLTWEQKLAELTRVYVDMFIYSQSLERLVLEIPRAYTQTQTGRASAESGALVKLAVGVGILWGLALERNIVVVPYEPQAWKGQLEKQVMEARIMQLYYMDGKSGITHGWKSHIWDAVGLGLHYFGLLSF